MRKKDFSKVYHNFSNIFQAFSLKSGLYVADLPFMRFTQPPTSGLEIQIFAKSYNKNASLMCWMTSTVSSEWHYYYCKIRSYSAHHSLKQSNVLIYDLEQVFTKQVASCMRSIRSLVESVMDNILLIAAVILYRSRKPSIWINMICKSVNESTILIWSKKENC